jgi:hypothetical protein
LDWFEGGDCAQPESEYHAAFTTPSATSASILPSE